MNRLSSAALCAAILLSACSSGPSVPHASVPIEIGILSVNVHGLGDTYHRLKQDESMDHLMILVDEQTGLRIARNTLASEDPRNFNDYVAAYGTRMEVKGVGPSVQIGGRQWDRIRLQDGHIFLIRFEGESVYSMMPFGGVQEDHIDITYNDAASP